MPVALKTLIVDDEEFSLSIMEQMLNQLEIFDITKCSCSSTALQLFGASLGETPYRLIFLDIMMPAPNGQEVLKQMRQMEKEAGIAPDRRAIIIMATALHSPDDMLEAIIDGDCTDYIVKPYDLDYLHKVISKYL